MKNWVTSNKKKHQLFSLKTLVAAGVSLIGVGALLLLTFFISTDSLQKSQDTRSDASIKDGKVAITLSHNPASPEPNQASYFLLKLNTKSTAVEEVSLLFDVITETTGELTVEGMNQLLEYEVVGPENVAHGFKVQVTATPKVPTGYATGDQATDFLKVSYTPSNPGPVTLNFDREKSIVLPVGSDGDTAKDELTHLPVYNVNVVGDTPLAVEPQPEDFYLVANDFDSRFQFFETTGSRNSIDPARLIKDTTYTVRHTALVQNLNEDPLTLDPVILTELKVNNAESVTRTFKRADLSRQTTPLEIQLETTFKAKDVNNFVVTTDSTGVFPEINEGNNALSISFSTSSTIKACNENCSSNAECGDGYRCYDTGSDGKRCRIATNLTNTSCSQPVGGRNTCNQYCADTNECAAGFTCWNNFCRNPYNVENTACVNPSTRQQELIRETCNDTCSANRDCANNMRCFNGSCRLATNPSSTSCVAATEATVSKGYTAATPVLTPLAIATPRPTATPRATATPAPTASASAVPTPVATPVPTPQPTPIPTPEPEQTALDSVFGQIQGWWNTISSNMSGMTSGALVPIAVIGAGVLLLLVALMIMLRPGRKPHVMTTTPVTPTTPEIKTKESELHARPNPPPPPLPSHGTIQPKKTVVPTWGGQSLEATAISKPDVIELPPDKSAPGKQSPEPEVKPEPSRSLPSPSAPGAADMSKPPLPSMLQRLKEKGVNIPEKKVEATTTPTAAAPTGDAKPPSSGWPDEGVK